MSTAQANLNATRGGPRIAGLLSIAFDQAMAAVTAEVAPHHPDLRPAHLQIFRLGSIEGRRATELAALARMTKQSMHELVGHLERHGYLTREVDPGDVRARLLRLTPRGQQLEDQVVAASARLQLSWREALGADRFDVLWAGLQEITGGSAPAPSVAQLRSDARADRAGVGDRGDRGTTPTLPAPGRRR